MAARLMILAYMQEILEDDELLMVVSNGAFYYKRRTLLVARLTLFLPLPFLHFLPSVSRSLRALTHTIFLVFPRH